MKAKSGKDENKDNDGDKICNISENDLSSYESNQFNGITKENNFGKYGQDSNANDKENNEYIFQIHYESTIVAIHHRFIRKNNKKSGFIQQDNNNKNKKNKYKNTKRSIFLNKFIIFTLRIICTLTKF